MPLIFGIIQHFFTFKHKRSSIVCEIVNTAELLDGLINEPVQICFLCDISLDNMESITESSEFLFNRHCFVNIASISYRNVMTCLKECFGHLPSQFCCTGRDECVAHVIFLLLFW